MKYVVLFAHRRRFVPYFQGIAKHLPQSRITQGRDLLKALFPIHLPDKAVRKKMIDYECSKKFYHPKTSFLKIRELILTVWVFLKVVWIYSSSLNLLKTSKCDTLVVWGAGGLYQKLMARAARDIKCEVFVMENGFMPNTTAIDSKGVNAESQIPRNKEFFLQLDSSELPQDLPKKLVVREQKRPKKVDSNSSKRSEKYIFVPFQCNADSVIILHSPRIKNMWDLFFDVVGYAAKFPELDFVLKEHPSCPEDYGSLYEYLKLHNIKNVYFRNSDNTETLIRESLGVMTINSSVGIESLMFGKPVIALGTAAYNIDDLVLFEKEGRTEKSIEKLLQGWLPNPELRDKFLRYVFHVYLVRGTRREESQDHFTAVADRILTSSNINRPV